MTSVYASIAKRFARVQTISREVNQIQDRIASATDPFFDQPFFGGVLLTDVLLTAGYGNQIQHGLGREPLGFVLAGANAYAMVCENTSSRTDKIIELNTTATATVSLWIY